METVVAVFKLQESAVDAFDALRSAGVPPNRISVLFPGGLPDRQIEPAPITDAGTIGSAEDPMEGPELELGATVDLQRDEAFFCYDALRQGHYVVIASASDDQQAETFRGIIREAGAGPLDATTQPWSQAA